MTRFTLERGRWYVLQILGDQFSAGDNTALSPIRIESVTPLKTNQRQLELSFFHASYPDGVRDKTYKLTTINRGRSSLLAQSDHEPPRFLHITDLSMEWLKHHFPQCHFTGECPQECLNEWLSPRSDDIRLLSQFEATEASGVETVPHWSNDRFWADAYDGLERLRRQGNFSLNMAAIEDVAFRGDGPAYKLLEAMVSVWERESWDGHKGAPRVMLLLLARLAEISDAVNQRPPWEE